MRQFFEELKKRNVYRVATAYGVSGWLVLQVVDIVGPGLGWSESVQTLLIKLLIAGFPVSLVLAWLYELTPKGFKRTGALQEDTSDNKKVGRRLNQFIIGILALALSLLLAERLFFSGVPSPRGFSGASIAILPFKNDSPDAENMYFCDGITEGVRENLSRIPSLSVISRTSVEQFRHNPPSVSEIGKKLKAQYILEGSVLRLEDRSVIRARLIFAPEERSLWSQEYDRELQDVFMVLAEVTQNIANELETTISPEVMHRIEEQPTEDLTAYDYYLQGQLYLNNSESTENNDALQKADLLFRKALQRDPTYAQAQVGRIRVFREQHKFEFFENATLIDSMLVMCNKAIAMDPDLADAYWVRGAFYDDFLYDIPKATKDLSRAVELNPNLVGAIGQLAVLKWVHHREIIPALRLYRKLEKLEHSPRELYGAYINQSLLYWDLWDHEKGYYYLDKAIPLYPGLKGLKAWYYVQQGRYNEAVELMKDTEEFAALGFFHLLLKEYEKALEYYELWEIKVAEEGVQEVAELESWHRYGQVLAGLGRTKEAQELMEYQLNLNEKLQKNYQRAHAIFYESAGIYSFLGKHELAFEYLRKFDSINRWDDGKLHFIQRDPSFDNIREIQEFKMIVDKRMEEIRSVQNKVARLEASGEL
ncbi:hypothetical protein ACT6NV_06510 [Robiginitalea sp. IMCC44478]|uniref:hypothetical protein n=1 Tax=Robiginitalea sp. IMCC44478 TaxID=3459122 RepID=UPI0040434F78